MACIGSAIKKPVEIHQTHKRELFSGTHRRIRTVRITTITKRNSLCLCVRVCVRAGDRAIVCVCVSVLYREEIENACPGAEAAPKHLANTWSVQAHGRPQPAPAQPRPP